MLSHKAQYCFAHNATGRNEMNVQTELKHAQLMENGDISWLDCYYAMKSHADDLEQQLDDWKELSHDAVTDLEAAIKLLEGK